MTYLGKLKKAVRRLGGKGRFQIDQYLAECVSQDMAEQLIANAEVLGPPVTVLIEEEPGQCHANSMKYVATKGGTLWSGFALGEGVWRVHSWVVKDGAVIEATPFACERYVGIAVNSLERVFACYGHHPGFPLEWANEVRRRVSALVAQEELASNASAQRRAASPRGWHRELRRKGRRLPRPLRDRHRVRPERGVKRTGDLQ